MLKIRTDFDDHLELHDEWAYDDEPKEDIPVETESRSGTHHGRDGWKRRPSAEDMARVEKEQIGSVNMTTLLSCCGGRSENIANLIWSLWLGLQDRRRLSGDSTGHILTANNRSKAASYIKNIIYCQPRKGYEVLPAPSLGVCLKYSKGVLMGVGYVMERPRNFLGLK